MAEMARELVREMSLLHEDREILLQVQEDAEIIGDENMLKQLLWIHGENALKYSSGVIEVSVRRSDTHGYISVRDYGIGIEAEDIPRLFDRFFRADKSRNKEIAGTGLGLSIASLIVDAHGGEILVDSTAGVGTAFTDKFLLCMDLHGGKEDIFIRGKYENCFGASVYNGLD